MPLVLLLACYLVCAVGLSGPEELRTAFAKDNYELGRCTSTTAGWGCVGNSTVSTNLRTGDPKKAFYVQGTPYAWGYTVAMLADSDMEVAVTSFLQKIPLALIAPDWIASHDGWAVKELERIIEHILTVSAVKAFEVAYGAGDIHESIMQEMQGLVDGAKAANPQSAVTLQLLQALNYGFDVITARIFSGHLLVEVRDAASPALRTALLRSPKAFRELSYCNGVGVKGSFVTAEYSGFLGRDFQFATARILQDYLAMGVFASSSSSNLTTSVRVFAPGFVGAFAAMNVHGVAMGVNTIRSANSNISNVGINSLLMIRSVVESASSSLSEAVSFVQTHQRGAPFMYPLCDASGDCAVLEAGRYLPGNEVENPLDYVEHSLKALLPTDSFIASHRCPTQAHGVFVRYMNYSYPEAYFEQFTPALWEKFAEIPFNASAMTTVEGMVYATFEEDNASSKHVKNKFFMPQIETDPEMVIVTNFAVVPENRMMMMNDVDDLLAESTGEALIWRYQVLLQLLTRAKGKIDFAEMVWIMDFLAPNRTPNYWNTRLHENDPMSTIIEGTTSVFDLKHRVVTSHFGYFADKWVNISLANYV